MRRKALKDTFDNPLQGEQRLHANSARVPGMSLSKPSMLARTGGPSSLMFLLLLMLQIFSFPTSAADAIGHFERYCDGAWFYLSNVDGLPASNKLVLFFRVAPPGLALTQGSWWTQVYAKRCSSDDKCEDATSARMWLDKGASVAKRISGKYEADFNAELLRGQFFAKERKPTQKRVCE